HMPAGCVRRQGCDGAGVGAVAVGDACGVEDFADRGGGVVLRPGDLGAAVQVAAESLCLCDALWPRRGDRPPWIAVPLSLSPTYRSAHRDAGGLICCPGVGSAAK